MDREARIEEAVTFLRENADEDQAVVVELLKDDGYDGNDIMDALSRVARRDS